MAGEHIIFALASPPQRSALHLHRISGVGCAEALCQRLAHSARTHELESTVAHSTGAFDVSKIKGRYSYYLHLIDSLGHLIDDVIVTFYFGKASYTGEDSIEISCHGNPLIDAQIQSCLRELGFSDAKPGEFTQRAYLNGKLDLTQAEAIAALIETDSAAGIQLARDSARGSIQRTALAIKTHLIELRAQLEAHIDFSDQEIGDLPWPHLSLLCSQAREILSTLEKSYDKGKRLREGLRVALVGEPNAGKSSLYNALLDENLAIVSDEKGTTRDVLRERLVIDGRDFVLSDTAGIRNADETLNKVETLGIERSVNEAKVTDLILFVVDAQALCSNWAGLEQILTLESQAERLLVLSKTDLLPEGSIDLLHKRIRTRVSFSSVAVHHENITELEKALCTMYDKLLGNTITDSRHPNLTGAPGVAGVTGAAGAVLLSIRQRDQITRALSYLLKAEELCSQKAFPEIIASELIACENALTELLGRVDIEEIFGSIFSSFCIGK